LIGAGAYQLSTRESAPWHVMQAIFGFFDRPGRFLGSGRKNAAIGEATSPTSIARKIGPPVRTPDAGSLN
jgi:hypothetical protein